MKGWSKTQTLVALSSGESEFYAALKAAAETLGVMSMMEDLGYKVKGRNLGRCQCSPRHHSQEWPEENEAH